MSSSPALAQLSPDPSPSFSSALLSSPPRPTPSTPTFASASIPHVPPTPPDSTARTAPNTASSPSSNSTAQSVVSRSSPLSAAAPQFQSRLLDTPIDIHELAPELGSPSPSVDSAPSVSDRDNGALYKTHEQGSPKPVQEGAPRKGLADALPPPFVPAAARVQYDPEQDDPKGAPPASPGSGPHPPNVYINGLPPNFPEEDLLAMTSPFGSVLSVRTFTRHVSDKPSGYGFVLFESLDAAEKCIESLRKYRNLHPSFSKQVHKIPGTTYASAPSACTTGPPDSFKVKMEQLRDTGSTNLYMEGLPLSITEETLRALVNPYRIMSSRFFHTRLSSPPRIIAFVRLESRDAAEDIIERLHGRLVRGWNDAGCRISVRFADTADQRELRRTERHGREDEQSPARLTMARAALLNLKGTQCQSDDLSPTLGNMDLVDLQTSPNLGLALNNLGLGHLGGSLSPSAGLSPLQTQGPFAGGVGRQRFSSFSSSTSDLDAFNTPASHVPTHDLRIPQQALPGNASGLLDEQSQLQLALMSMQGLRTGGTQHGYTPVEQLILQAHARQRGDAIGGSADTGPGHLHDARSSVGLRLASARDANRRLLGSLPQMSEDDFHAAANRLQSQQNVAQRFSRDANGRTFAHPGADAQSASLLSDLERRLSVSDQQTRQRNHTLASQVCGNGDTQGLHTRSSTLPSQYLGLRNPTQALPPTHNTLYDSGTSANVSFQTQQTRSGAHAPRTASHKHVPQSPSISNAPRHTSISNLSTNPQTNTHALFTSKSNINLPSIGHRAAQHVNTGAHVTSPSAASVAAFSTQANRTKNGSLSGASAIGHLTDAREGAIAQDADADDGESPIVSPALTYSARTPVTLSPATPYSGFFSDGGDAFKGTALCGKSATEGPNALRPTNVKDVGETVNIKVATGMLDQ
ncbi:hypothetical protein VTO73DRAFT_6721 [Trametes versicolor]